MLFFAETQSDLDILALHLDLYVKITSIQAFYYIVFYTVIIDLDNEHLVTPNNGLRDILEVLHLAVGLDLQVVEQVRRGAGAFDRGQVGEEGREQGLEVGRELVLDLIEIANISLSQLLPNLLFLFFQLVTLVFLGFFTKRADLEVIDICWLVACGDSISEYWSPEC